MPAGYFWVNFFWGGIWTWTRSLEGTSLCLFWKESQMPWKVFFVETGFLSKLFWWLKWLDPIDILHRIIGLMDFERMESARLSTALDFRSCKIVKSIIPNKLTWTLTNQDVTRKSRTQIHPCHHVAFSGHIYTPAKISVPSLPELEGPFFSGERPIPPPVGLSTLKLPLGGSSQLGSIVRDSNRNL